MLRHVSPLICLSLLFSACGSTVSDTANRPGDSQLASFVIKQFEPEGNLPSWEKVKLEVERVDGDAKKINREFARSSFRDGQSGDMELTLEYGRYRILLTYTDVANKVTYETCPDFRVKDHVIQEALYNADIEICPLGSSESAGNASVTPGSNVVVKPVPGGAKPTTPSTCKDASGKILAGHDEVLGQCVDQKTSYYVKDGEIYSRGQKIQLRGINWFGMDSFAEGAISLGGLWSRPKIEDILVQLKGLGFNALRIPLAPEAFRTGTRGRFGYATSLDNLKDLLRLSDVHGFHVLLDIHNCGADKGHTTGTPTYCSGYYPQGWLNDLKTLGEIAKDYKSVVGIDLYNEPYQLTWDEWREMANQGAQAVLKANPRTLVFVEGVGGKSAYGRFGPFWGANLHEALQKPLSIPGSRLVFSPHTYGPGVFADHDYFKVAEFPNNMPAIWDEHFGYLRDRGHVIAVGEFGGFYRDSDKVWQDAFVSYLIANDIKHFFYWSLNPESGDTGGLFNGDWTSVNQEKLQLLKRLMQ